MSRARRDGPQGRDRQRRARAAARLARDDGDHPASDAAGTPDRPVVRRRARPGPRARRPRDRRRGPDLAVPRAGREAARRRAAAQRRRPGGRRARPPGDELGDGVRADLGARAGRAALRRGRADDGRRDAEGRVRRAARAGAVPAAVAGTRARSTYSRCCARCAVERRSAIVPVRRGDRPARAGRRGPARSRNSGPTGSHPESPAACPPLLPLRAASGAASHHGSSLERIE